MKKYSIELTLSRPYTQTVEVDAASATDAIDQALAAEIDNSKWAPQGDLSTFEVEVNDITPKDFDDEDNEGDED